MRPTVLALSWILRLAAVIQLLLGILFWTGHAYTYVPVHLAVGSALVLALWAIAVLALVAGVKRRLAVFELFWGLALPAFGVMQAGILIGPMHWMIRVIHLLMAISAVKLGESLGNTLLAAAPTTLATQKVGGGEPSSSSVRRVS